MFGQAGSCFDRQRTPIDQDKDQGSQAPQQAPVPARRQPTVDRPCLGCSAGIAPRRRFRHGVGIQGGSGEPRRSCEFGRTSHSPRAARSLCSHVVRDTPGPDPADGAELGGNRRGYRLRLHPVPRDISRSVPETLVLGASAVSVRSRVRLPGNADDDPGVARTTAPAPDHHRRGTPPGTLLSPPVRIRRCRSLRAARQGRRRRGPLASRPPTGRFSISSAPPEPGSRPWSPPACCPASRRTAGTG